MLQAIYGFIELALLWYKLYTEILLEQGYNINPYDRCVEDEFIKGKQCTMAGYVDDNKALHVHPKVIDELSRDLKEDFKAFVVKRGLKHCFLGINIQIIDNKGIEINIKEFIFSSTAPTVFGKQ